MKEKNSLKLKDNQLTQSKLKKYGQKVTKIRKVLRDRALAAGSQYSEEMAERYLAGTEALARKMHQGYFRVPKSKNIWKMPH